MKYEKEFAIFEKDSSPKIGEKYLLQIVKHYIISLF
jgi:hypothetical protein